MKPALKKDLKLLSEILEDLVSGWANLSVADQIDVAARLKPIHKNANKILEDNKEFVKKKRNGKPGAVLGEDFKAVMSHVPTTRLNQKLLKEEQPKVHAKYNESVVDDRITYELR
jgi:hypothetical protein